MNKIKKIIFIIFTSVSTCFLTLILLELLLSNFLHLGQPIIYDSSYAWGYSPRPNLEYDRFYGSKVTINDAGLRSKKSWEKDTNRRIVFLGDSVTYGGSIIDDDAVFANLACKNLNNWSCFNGGVNAYGVLNMVARSRYDQRIKDAKMTIFVFINEDFIRGLKDQDSYHFILREPPKFFRASWELANFLAARYNLKYLFGKKVDSYLSEKETQLSKSAAAEFAIDNLLEEVRRLDAVDKEVLLIHLPSVPEIEGYQENWEIRLQEALKKKFPKNFVSVLPEMKKVYMSQDKEIFMDDIHLRNEGHVIFAQILNEIIKKKLINGVD